MSSNYNLAPISYKVDITMKRLTLATAILLLLLQGCANIDNGDDPSSVNLPCNGSIMFTVGKATYGETLFGIKCFGAPGGYSVKVYEVDDSYIKTVTGREKNKESLWDTSQTK